MSTQFTPGPWFYASGQQLADEHGGDAGWFVYHSGIESDETALAWFELEGDARKSAAAPDLLAELEWLAAFAQMRSEDDSKVFARVNRGALRNIAERCRAAINAAVAPEGRDEA